MKGCDTVAIAALLCASLAAPSAAQNKGRVVQYDTANAAERNDTQAADRQTSSAAGNDDSGTTARLVPNSESPARPGRSTARTQGVELIVGGSSKDGAAKKLKLPIK